MGKAVILSVVALLGIWLALLSQEQSEPTPPPERFALQEPGDPSRNEEALHLLETHGIRIGEATENDIVVKRVEGKLQIELTEEFLSKVPDALLDTLGWTGSSNWVSDDGYHDFLNSLHTFLIQEMPEEHAHAHGDHDHSGDDHDSHEDHDHSHH